MSYSGTAIRGVSWSIAQRWIIRGLTFVRLAILARLLLPVQFGVFSVATIVLGLLEILTETWINVFLIQEKGSIDRYVNTAWILSIIRGLVISLLIFIFAPAVSAFFNSSQSLHILRLIALVPLLRGFINPSIAKLQKELRFYQEFLFRTLLFTLEAIVAIIYCFIYRDVSGLAWGMIISAVVEVIFSLVLFKPIPKFTWVSQYVSQIIHQGKWITAAGIFNYLYQHGDDIVVGKLLGETGLGLYDPIYKISGLPVSEVSDVVAKVSFPMFVNIRHNSHHLQNAFYKTLSITTSITTIFGLGVFIFAPQIILIVLGPNWLTAISALRVLCLYGVSKAIINSIYPLFLATKHQEYITYTTLISVIVLGITIYPLVQFFGLVGAGISATLGSLIVIPLSFIYVRKIFIETK
jgi:O-antigen/teichoic acid export membrane protein